MSDELSELHLADLHARAAEQGVEGYRLLRREELIERLSSASSPEPGRRRRGRRGGRGRGGRERERLPAGEGRDRREGRDEPRPAGDEAEEVTESVTGILELTRQRHGFVRAPGLGAREDDVYVSASQVRRCELRAGDEVSGPARSPRRGERHRALTHVDTVNGGPPQEEGRVDFDDLTPAPPTRRIRVPQDAGTLARGADLLAPLAYGQRVLVRAVPRSGRTTLLRELAAGLRSAEGARVVVLLIDERPEDVPAWRELEPEVELALAPADLAPRDQVRIAELAVERARRLAEAGTDAILLCDSLSRLAVAADGVADVKRLFGSGRDLAEETAGSLTVVATAFAEGDDEGSAERAVSTTESVLIELDPALADQGVVPALRFDACRAVAEESLLEPRELVGLRSLRSALREQSPTGAAELVSERLAGGATSQEILNALGADAGFSSGDDG
jgi:transcription termination factor Rho